MALPLRTRAIPQRTSCLRSYTPSSYTYSSPPESCALKQQVRGKKKMANNSATTTVRLLRNVPGFGKRGAIVPVPTGHMRNRFFPQRIAEYITVPELRTIRASNVPIERDYAFGQQQKKPVADVDSEQGWVPGMPLTDPTQTAKEKERELAPEKLDPERGTQLLEIFVKPVLQFYRQPILEEAEPEPEGPASEPKRERQRTASSAAADLLAARTAKPKPKPAGPQGIYGSVSTHDILVHVRAALATNDEAARVILGEEDIRFLDREVETERKVKHVGDFTIEIRVKGAAEAIKRTVRVTPQEA
ncbi:Hypothetical predicted protein [Lecanosticta acicola]|uniref:Ribosomal protein L9 domain-containing protein n=1 Tax=Lecanosticta acicola TaxID=111012 RepID=A0AAI8YVB7_9PEZI|nr:Hypothetical predicted protein [Lecanosticta acicola]